MTKSVLEFDEIAADDALIEAIRSGATADDVPAEDPAASVLIALRDGAAGRPEMAPTPVRVGIGGLVRRRRLVASGVAACVLALAGVGTAVAGDPTAAFRFVFHQGVGLGSRFGTPEGEDHAQQPLGGGVDSQTHSPRSSAPVRQGSAAAPWSSDGTRARSLGYEQEHQDWTRPDDPGLRPETLRDQGISDVDGSLDQNQPYSPVPTQIPEPEQNYDQTTPPDDSYGPQSDDPTIPEEDGPTPTESSPTTPETTTPTPTLTSPTPTEMSPTSPSPTTPAPTSPTPTETSPTSPAPTSAAPTESPSSSGTPSSAPSPTESIRTQ